MFSGNTISIKTILWRVFNRPVTEGLNYEDAAEYAIEGLKLIGAPLVFIDTFTNPPLKIENHKAALPSCIINIRGIKLLTGNNSADIALRRATDIHHASIPCIASDGSNPSCVTTTVPTNPYDPNYTGVNTSIVQSDGATTNQQETFTEYTYTAQGGVLQTSFREGSVIISYKTLAVDKEGYPLIPDNQKVKLALEYYILYRFIEPLWEMGKIPDKVFHRIEQEKFWYISAANTDMQLQGGDHLESVMNSINRLIVNDKAFSNFYKGSGEKEKIKKYY